MIPALKWFDKLEKRQANGVSKSSLIQKNANLFTFNSLIDKVCFKGPARGITWMSEMVLKHYVL